MGTIKNKILILHGWAYSTEKWQPFLSKLEARGVRGEILKIPGLTAPLEDVWTLSDYIAWLDIHVKKNTSKVILMGHSNGGRIAVAYAARRPGHVAKLILIDSAGIPDKRLKTHLKKAVFGAAAFFGKMVIKNDNAKNLLYKFAGEHDYNKANPVLKKTMLNLISEDLTPDFEKIEAPTLIIWGDQDSATPVSDGEKIHALTPNSQLYLVAGGRHSPQYTHPQEVSDAVLSFID